MEDMKRLWVEEQGRAEWELETKREAAEIVCEGDDHGLA